MRFLLYSYAFVAFIVTICSLFAMVDSATYRTSMKPSVTAFAVSVITSVVSVSLAQYVFT